MCEKYLKHILVFCVDYILCIVHKIQLSCLKNQVHKHGSQFMIHIHGLGNTQISLWLKFISMDQKLPPHSLNWPVFLKNQVHKHGSQFMIHIHGLGSTQIFLWLKFISMDQKLPLHSLNWPVFCVKIQSKTGKQVWTSVSDLEL